MKWLVINSFIEDISNELGVSPTFCYIILVIFILTITFGVISWIIGAKRRNKAMKEMNKKVCPGCGGDNEPDALLCMYCEEML